MHDLAERGIMKDLAALGYDTVMLEEPHNLEEPLATYLSSARTKEDWRAVATAHVDAHLKPPVTRPEPKSLLGRLGRGLASIAGGGEMYAYTRLRQADIERLETSTWSGDIRRKAHHAHALGLRVSLCDVDSTHGRYHGDSEKKKFAATPERNALMAQKIAAAVQAGRRVMLITGAAHLSEALSPGSSLPLELEKLGVPAVSFALPLLDAKGLSMAGKPNLKKGEREMVQKLMEAADYQVKGPEVGSIVAQRLQGVAFQRSGSAPVEIGGAGLSK
jgi:hypothetical protein